MACRVNLPGMESLEISKCSTLQYRNDVYKNNKKSIIIGEGMRTVRKVAKQLQAEGIDVKWYQAWNKNMCGKILTPDEFKSALARNKRWMDQKMKSGYLIYDIGIDPQKTRRSPFYLLERKLVDSYGYPTFDIAGRRP